MNVMVSDKSQRYEHLDAMRGYAALSIIFCHTVVSYSHLPEPVMLGGLTGRVPVLFFFILSGFVLGRSMLREENFGFRAYGAFCIRRFFRLYPPYLATLLIIVLIQTPPVSGTGLNHGESIFAGKWIERITTAFPSFSDFLNFLFMTDLRLNPPMWSLRAEIICSLLLPFLHLYTQRRPNWAPGILLFLILLRLPLSVDPMGFFSSVQYLFVFYLGYLICRADLSWVEKMGYQKWSYALPCGFVILAMAMRQSDFNDLPASFLIAGFFILLVPNMIPNLREILHTRFSRILGQCSFSVYLIHLQVIIAVYGSGMAFSHPPILHGVTLFLISTLIILPVAILMQKGVENPCNRVGHWLSDQIHQRPKRIRVVNQLAA